MHRIFYTIHTSDYTELYHTPKIIDTADRHITTTILFLPNIKKGYSVCHPHMHNIVNIQNKLCSMTYTDDP